MNDNSLNKQKELEECVLQIFGKEPEIVELINKPERITLILDSVSEFLKYIDSKRYTKFLYSNSTIKRNFNLLLKPHISNRNDGVSRLITYLIVNSEHIPVEDHVLFRDEVNKCKQAYLGLVSVVKRELQDFEIATQDDEDEQDWDRQYGFFLPDSYMGVLQDMLWFMHAYLEAHEG